MKKAIQNVELSFVCPQNWDSMTVCGNGRLTPSVNFMKMVMFVILSFVTTEGNSQKADNEMDTNKYDCILLVEPNPEFIGGTKAMYQFLGENIKYPQTCRNIDGTVYVGFVVNTDGSITDVKVKRGVHADIDSEAVRVVQLMSGKWKPGMQNGKPARVSFLLPMKFRLESEQTVQKQDSIPAPVICGIFNPIVQKDKNGESFYVLVEDNPEFIDGQKALFQFIKDNLKNPSSELGCMEGTVYIGFMVETDGRLTDIQVKRSFHPDFSTEALRVVNLMQGKWKAGKQGGKPVRTAYTIPIKFRLE